ncbi:MAG: ShlB/FhaC/HecB family hemolysin secretion/activation protein [Erythrobacter sp.]|jgi:hemolysin activation/secretion protein|uniref:ShlB/FhaC/HecB family hemolysin secretion/activation protein n=1 Tax=Erythrobacter sp. TaxID=1042 RepID=UPI002B4708E8|nr:ShlB/FhaC/HecB family hemolysin secretion/activation protein [Erythrobacter sp.]WRH70248.1 MAG: ShlB/FhaC/HecB family hemolysin secretion/activation protein [Erythrobacter sp.]
MALGLGAMLVPVSAASAQAQITPPNRTDLVPPELRREEQRPTLTIDGDFERPPCALDRPEFADIKFTVAGAQFNGLDRVPGLSLEDAVASYKGREVPVSVLCDIRAEANAILRRQGYLATVEIPEQTLADNTPDFNVVFGRLTSVRVRGDAGPSEKIVAGYLEKLTAQSVFNTNQAERYLLLADDLPGLDVRLSLRPAAGGAPGDLVGEIAVIRQRAMVDLNVQNLGSQAIGRFGGVLRGEAYDVTGLGDRTTLALFSTLDFTEQQTVQLGHDFRVGSEGLRLGGQLTWSTVNPSVGLAGFNVDSETWFASVFASYPLVRNRRSSLFADAGFDYVDQDVVLNGFGLTRDRVRMAFARLSGDMTDQQSVLRAGGYSPYEPKFRMRYGVELRQGLDVMSASPDCRPNLLGCLFGGGTPPSRIEADPTPLLARFNASVEYRPVPKFTLALTSQAQFTGDALPAFEELAGGSFSIGRGYDPGSVLGDSGVMSSFEMRYGSLAPASVDGWALQPYVFSDVAFVWNEDPSRSPTNPDRLWSVGGGVRVAWGPGLQSDFLIAVPLERPDLALTRGDVRFMFSLTARLLPWRF